MSETKLVVRESPSRSTWTVIELESSQVEYFWDVKRKLFEGTLLECESYIRLKEEGYIYE